MKNWLHLSMENLLTVTQTQLWMITLLRTSSKPHHCVMQGSTWKAWLCSWLTTLICQLKMKCSCTCWQPKSQPWQSLESTNRQLSSLQIAEWRFVFGLWTVKLCKLSPCLLSSPRQVSFSNLTEDLMTYGLCSVQRHLAVICHSIVLTTMRYDQNAANQYGCYKELIL